MRGAIIIIFHLRQQQVEEVALAAHDNVVKTFPADQSFDIPALPWRPWRRSADRECPLIELVG